MYVQAGAGIVADFESEIRAAGMRQQGQGAVPRRRGRPSASQRRAGAGSDAGLRAADHAGKRRASIICISIRSIPTAAIDFYIRQFPSTSKTTWGGLPGAEVADQCPDPVQQGRHAAADVAADRDLAFRLARRRLAQEPRGLPGAGPDVAHFPLYTGGRRRHRADQQRHLAGRRRARTDARARSPTPRRTASSRRASAASPILQGPDGAIVEYLGNRPAERMNHVHMFQEHPFCARALVPEPPQRGDPVAGRTSGAPMTEANCQVAARTRTVLAGDGARRASTARRAPRSSSATWR